MSSKAALDQSHCQNMAELIEKLTMSGRSELDADAMKKLKKICRLSDEYVEHAFYLVMTQLEKDHSEIRLSSLQIFDELFERSHCFRELLLSDFQNFMELTLEIDQDFPLPPPVPVAKALKSKALAIIQKWYEKFGPSYKKLALGYDFLKSCKKVSFQGIQSQTAIERQRDTGQRERQQRIEEDRLASVTAEMNEMSADIENTLIQADNCLLWLFPTSSHLFGMIAASEKPDSDILSKPDVLTHSKSDSRETNVLAHSKPESAQRELEVSTCSKPETAQRDMEVSTYSKPELAHRGLKVSTHSKPESAQRDLEVLTRSKPELAHSEPELTPSECELAVAEREAVTNTAEFGRPEDDFGGSLYSGSRNADEDLVERHSGFGCRNNSVDVEVAVNARVEVTENEDNVDLVRNLVEFRSQMRRRMLPLTQKWLETLARYGGDQSLVRRALVLRKSLETMLRKVEKVKVIQPSSRCLSAGESASAKAEKKENSEIEKEMTGEESSEDEKEEFEEVPEKEGYEPRVPDHMRAEYGLVKKPPKPPTVPVWLMAGGGASKVTDREEESDPTSMAGNLKKLREQLKGESRHSTDGETSDSQQPTTSGESSRKRKSEAISGVPVVPFGTDLYHWGESDTAIPLKVQYEQDKFWHPITMEDGDVVDKVQLELIKSRVINFTGNFEPVKWKCRAPLPNGKLCPRMDRIKCPFHGKIIARNEDGLPAQVPGDKQVPVFASSTKASISQSNNQSETGESSQSWDDPELQRDIQAATGIDLTRKAKKKGKGKGARPKNKFPELTDLKTAKSTSRQRLKDKVLNKTSLERVAQAMNAFDAKLRKDKFGNQFNYALSRR